MVIEDEMCSFGCSRSFLWYWSAQLLRERLALRYAASCTGLTTEWWVARGNASTHGSKTIMVLPLFSGICTILHYEQHGQ